jgi:hypothetical protein
VHEVALIDAELAVFGFTLDDVGFNAHCTYIRGGVVNADICGSSAVGSSDEIGAALMNHAHQVGTRAGLVE